MYSRLYIVPYTHITVIFHEQIAHEREREGEREREWRERKWREGVEREGSIISGWLKELLLCYIQVCSGSIQFKEYNCHLDPAHLQF